MTAKRRPRNEVSKHNSDTNLLTRVRAICAKLPDTEESSRLGGEPHFYVGGKIYAGCGIEDGTWCAGMKVGLELQSLLITRPGFRIAKYVGRYGWITATEAALADDAELERLIHLSYELIAGAPTSGPATKAARAAGKTGARKAAKQSAKKSAAKRRTVAPPRGGRRR